MSNKYNNDITDFGFRFVKKNEKTLMVFNIFSSVATKYDLMNDLMSFGIHRTWKRRLIKYSEVSYGHHVLDIAGGTGDLTVYFAGLVGDQGVVVLADINDVMLKEGRKKLRNLGLIRNIFYVQANVEALPFLNEKFDCVSMSFGFRNVTEKERALRSIYRVLKYGGRFLLLEFSQPSSGFLNTLYDIYSFYFLPKLGKLIVNDADSYRYLVESIRMHPSQDIIRNMMLNTGFCKVEYLNMTGGIVALHRGYKFN
ncbi:class I SAM-dependent methyltransferase [Blochmannia endosymbiont of Colobopsis nipponica]|uniref:class I SAM-dependent methyltransferase n=1 Tax=Blochmannia endosymbiont of Colobopsis nipponica TaxID=2681987 RepID=UPI001782368F|nr:class I SAM-dependent methyltransferase [Blochmannia endosymbiont of Colobopsis nipponica]QOI10851.1 class I SAM-dependent methyltransferase [Blochmannia endosymbiont of Colobopsis nipponica]